MGDASYVSDTDLYHDRCCCIHSDEGWALRIVSIMYKLGCYCFRYSENYIMQDVINNNDRSLILEKIKASKQEGSCRCHEKNPTGK